MTVWPSSTLAPRTPRPGVVDIEAAVEAGLADRQVGLRQAGARHRRPAALRRRHRTLAGADAHRMEVQPDAVRQLRLGFRLGFRLRLRLRLRRVRAVGVVDDQHGVDNVEERDEDAREVDLAAEVRPPVLPGLELGGQALRGPASARRPDTRPRALSPPGALASPSTPPPPHQPRSAPRAHCKDPGPPGSPSSGRARRPPASAAAMRTAQSRAYPRPARRSPRSARTWRGAWARVTIGRF